MASGPLCCVHRYFAAVDDPRVERCKLHRLLDIITIGLCGVLCGAESWVEIEQQSSPILRPGATR